MPDFLLGTLLIIWFSFDLHWFPVSPPADASAWAVFTDPRAFVLPVVTLSRHLASPRSAATCDRR